jgi:hypothetical protein
VATRVSAREHLEQTNEDDDSLGRHPRTHYVLASLRGDR